jgi:hypothetical protein
MTGMNMNPWAAERLVRSRIDDIERAARIHGNPRGSDIQPPHTAPTDRMRPAATRRVGLLLIAWGHRLSGTDGFPPAFDGSPRR